MRMETCPLLDPSAASRRECPWRDCRKPLPRLRRRWCSDACGLRFGIEHDFSREAILQRDKVCVRCGGTEHMEVNHKVPREGRGYNSGCYNHLEGLELLCRACHVKETAMQRKWRRLEAAAQRCGENTARLL